MILDVYESTLKGSGKPRASGDDPAGILTVGADET